MAPHLPPNIPNTPPSHTVTMETRGNCWEMDAEGVGGDGDSDGVNIGGSYAMVNIQRAWESRERRRKKRGR